MTVSPPIPLRGTKGFGKTEAYKEWVRPLLGDPLPKLMNLRN